MESDQKRQLALDVLYQTTSEEIMEAVGKVIGKAFHEKKGMPFVPVIDGELLVHDGNALMEEGKYHNISYMLGANANDITTEGQTVISPDSNLMHQGDLAYAKMVNDRKGKEAYVYYFTRRLPGDEVGAFHSAELWYIFGSLDYCWRPLEKADYQLSKKMISYWSSFMRTGNPNDAGEADWLPCTEEHSFYKVLDV